MSYIYDIVLNFHKNYYNFYEWNRTDKIKNIYKIPLYRVTDKDITSLIYNKVKVTKDFIEKLKENIHINKKIILLVSNTKTTIGLLFDENGKLLKRSSLIFEEENEANSVAKTLSITEIDYKTNIEEQPKNYLRIELEKKEQLKKYLNDLTDETTLKYLYYEYFNEESKQTEKIKTELLQELDKEWNNKKNNLYKIISLLIKNKLPSK